jgi:DNA polymerase-3 subunit epsilon
MNNMILERPLVIFDTETTGSKIDEARIIELGAIRINLDGTQKEFRQLINPLIPIPPASTAIHGITDADVSQMPNFKQIYPVFEKFIEGCDISGYNSDQFDVPLMIEECTRNGYDFEVEGRNYLDILKLQRHVHPQTLSAVYEFYTGEQMEGAHGALQDSQASLTVLNHILRKHFENDVTPKQLDILLQGEKRRVDISGKLGYNEKGEIVWLFGKNDGEPVVKDIGYINWALSDKASFPSDTKNILEVLKSDYYSSKFT